MEQLSLFDSQVLDCKFVICFCEIEKANGNYQRAAAALGMHRNTLARIMKECGWKSLDIGKVIRKRKLNGPPQLQSESNGGPDVLLSVRPGLGHIGPESTRMPKRKPPASETGILPVRENARAIGD
jgi:hypothetical protein